MNKIFLSFTAEGAVWVLLDTDLCQKQVCGKYSVQKSVLKINECLAFSTSGCQGIRCIPIGNTSFLVDRSVPFCLAFHWSGSISTDKFFVKDLKDNLKKQNKLPLIHISQILWTRPQLFKRWITLSIG